MSNKRIITGLKGHSWSVLVKEKELSSDYSYWYWEAHNDKLNYTVSNTFQFKNERNARGSWKDFAKAEGITHYTIL